MVRDFCAGFVPGLMIITISATTEKCTQHYSFADVNPVIAARFHIGRRRRFGSISIQPKSAQGRCIKAKAQVL